LRITAGIENAEATTAMKCENCREREATVHYTEIEGPEKKEVHLCQECHRQKAARPHKGIKLSFTWAFSDSAVEILALAQDEARRFGQDRIGSEHLLLALLKKEPDNLTLALGELPVQPKVLYDKIRLKLAAGKTPAEPEHQTGD
jgi:ATP-dependent Clp protease ATP-binding subunit ClpA